MKKHSAVFLFAALLALSIFAGCSSSGSSDNNGDSDFNENADETSSDESAAEDEIVEEIAEEAVEETPEPPVEEPEELAEEEAAAEEEGVAEEEASEPEIDEEEVDPCARKIGTEKCRVCGRPCESGDECPPGYACFFGECTRECVPDTTDEIVNDCGEGFGCVKVGYHIESTVYLDSYMCARGDGKICKGASDCAEGMMCNGFWPSWDMDGLVNSCQPLVPCAAKTGEACDSTTECEADWCKYNPLDNSQYCSAVCASDSDCPSSMQCRDVYMLQFYYGGPAVWGSYCVQKNWGATPNGSRKFCYQDSQCSNGELCIGVSMGITEDDMGELKRSCSKETEGGADYGAACPTDGVCKSQNCADGICTRPCRRIDGSGLGIFAECPASYDCKMKKYPVAGAKTAQIEMCKPYEGSLDDCLKDADCPSDEVCGALYVKNGEDKYTGRCMKPSGSLAFGQTCAATTSELSSKNCANSLCLKSEKKCTILCAEDADCGSGWSCKTKSAGASSLPVSVCVPDAK